MPRTSPQFELALAIAVVGVVSVWCASLIVPKAATVDLPDDELDVCEAVFRYQFQHNASGIQKADVYFLTIQSQNPSHRFIARFSDHSPPVRKGSRFMTGCG